VFPKPLAGFKGWAPGKGKEGRDKRERGRKDGGRSTETPVLDVMVTHLHFASPDDKLSHLCILAVRQSFAGDNSL